MRVVADSSPLIVLAKLNVIELIPKLYPHIYVSAEVYAEVVVAGAGLPGASSVAKAAWIEVKPIQNPAELAAAESNFNIGIGELSTMALKSLGNFSAYAVVIPPPIECASANVYECDLLATTVSMNCFMSVT